MKKRLTDRLGAAAAEDMEAVEQIIRVQLGLGGVSLHGASRLQAARRHSKVAMAPCALLDAPDAAVEGLTSH